MRGSHGLGVAGRSSQSPATRSGHAFMSKPKDSKYSPSRRSKNTAFVTSKADRVSTMVGGERSRGGMRQGTGDDEYSRRLERFSSQGQEELV